MTLAQTPSDVACLEITASGGRLVIGRFNVLALATKTFEMAALPLGEVLFSATVSGISNSVALAAGGHHTCALLADGTVACWGFNLLGQLGHGSVTEPLTTPVSVSGLSDAGAIAAGFEHSCALKTDGTVACWGDNERGSSATVR